LTIKIVLHQIFVYVSTYFMQFHVFSNNLDRDNLQFYEMASFNTILRHRNHLLII